MADWIEADLAEWQGMWEVAGLHQDGDSGELTAECIAGAAHYLRQLLASGLGAPGSRDPYYIRAENERRDNAANRALRHLGQAARDIKLLEQIRRRADSAMKPATVRIARIAGAEEDEDPILIPLGLEKRIAEIRMAPWWQRLLKTVWPGLEFKKAGAEHP